MLTSSKKGSAIYFLSSSRQLYDTTTIYINRKSYLGDWLGRWLKNPVELSIYTNSVLIHYKEYERMTEVVSCFADGLIELIWLIREPFLC